MADQETAGGPAAEWVDGFFAGMDAFRACRQTRFAVAGSRGSWAPEAERAEALAGVLPEADERAAGSPSFFDGFKAGWSDAYARAG